jgi:hypothetical protein
MESEKRAVQDFNGPKKSEAKAVEFRPLPIDRPTPNIVEGGPKDSIFSQHQTFKIPESNIHDTAATNQMN